MPVERPPDLRGWCAIGAALTAAFAAYISLVPFNFTWPADATLADAFHRVLETALVSRSNFAGNVLLFCPFGFFGAGAVFSAPRRTAGHVIGAAALVALSVALSFAIEFAQVFVPGRTPSLADVTAQTAGMLIGLAGWVLVALASGHFLSLLLRRFEDELTEAQKGGLSGGGYWIGVTERSLIYLFILIGEPSGIGFLAAAKSVFRIGELKEAEDRKLAEYILIGTLVSFTVAMVIGLLTREVVRSLV